MRCGQPGTQFRLAAGATGLIFGRNIWQRPFAEALAISRRLTDLLREHGR